MVFMHHIVSHLQIIKILNPCTGILLGRFLFLSFLSVVASENIGLRNNGKF